MITVCARAQQLRHALAVFRHLQQRGLKPEATAFNALLQVQCRLRDQRQGGICSTEALLPDDTSICFVVYANPCGAVQHMLSSSRTQLTYIDAFARLLVQGCAYAGAHEEALQVFHLMRASKV